MQVDRRGFAVGVAATGLLASLPSAARASENSLIAQTRHGKVKGFVRNGASVFLGLPYGADTSGARRFLPPVPPARWSGVRDATRPGQRAPQSPPPPPKGPLAEYFTGNRANEIETMPETLGEDCLVLNVITPATDRARRPVMVYFHGGGFTGGTGLVATLGDRFTVDEDVVLVSVNHRLGGPGFMYLGGLSQKYSAGNPGMLDLVASLQWIRDNITAFGGDPKKVTIFGESGGAIKISLLLAMPQAKGLFQGAIMQSGLYPTLMSPNTAAAATSAFMDKIGLKDVSSLQTLPFEKLVGPGAPGTVPTADGHTLRADPWLVAPEAANKIPLMIGYTKDELTLFALSEPALFKLEWQDVPEKLAARLAIQSETSQQLLSSYRIAYPQDGPSDSFFRITSDGTFGRAMFTIADRKAYQRPPVYFYRMELDSKLSPGLRSFHTAELPLTIGLNPRTDTTTLTRQISKAWAAFARTGNPNHSELPRWTRYRPGGDELMRFDLQSQFGTDPQSAARRLLFEAVKSNPQFNPLSLR